MYKTAILTLFQEARQRAEAGDLGIAAQKEIVAEHEKQGLSSEQPGRFSPSS
jgi:hypothetical protein